VLARLLPARAGVPQDYLATLAQRNAALRRVQIGAAPLDAVTPWTERLASAGAELVEARRLTMSKLSPAFAERAGELGLPAAHLEYDADPPTIVALEDRIRRDVERGATGLGPHLDEVGVTSAGRDLRQFGSQGEQRLAVLSLLLAEAELLPEPPLLLLDDVLSELDLGRRRVLAGRVSVMGQTVITSTHAGALPLDPDQLVEVERGTAR
jgi:DNA replication and repair protein RecF